MKVADPFLVECQHRSDDWRRQGGKWARCEKAGGMLSIVQVHDCWTRERVDSRPRELECVDEGPQEGSEKKETSPTAA
jgi:hypothetical protein